MAGAAISKQPAAETAARPAAWRLGVAASKRASRRAASLRSSQSAGERHMRLLVSPRSPPLSRRLVVSSELPKQWLVCVV